MKRGISFKVRNDTNIINHILAPIKVIDYSWQVDMSQEEVWASDYEDFFDKADYSGIEFEELIKRQYFVVFLKLTAFLKEKSSHATISSYEDFVKSAAQLLIMIIDCREVEIYCKDLNIIEKIYNYANQAGNLNVEYITDENDHRTEFIIR